MQKNIVDIFDNKIFITWNKVLPEKMRAKLQPGESYFLDSVPEYWTNLAGHTRYDRVSGKFTMSLSVQNLNRIEREFGEVNIRNGCNEYLKLIEKHDEFKKTLKTLAACKNLPIEQLPKYNFKMPPLAEYQHRGVAMLANVPEMAMFADCGLGKTYCVINACQIHKDKNVVSGPTLIIAKLTTVKSGWLEDIKKFSNLDAVILWEKLSNKKRKDIIRQRLSEQHDLYIINHDGVRLFEEELKAKNFEKVVIDESTVLKNFHNKLKAKEAFGKAVCNVSEYAKWRVIMTGTPMPNTPENLWGQFYFLNRNGFFLDKSFYDFQQEFMEKIDLRPGHARYDRQGRFIPLKPRDPSRWMPRKSASEALKSFVSNCSFRVRMKDHLKDMPPLTAIVRDIEMSPEQERHYKTMKDELRVVIDDERLTVNTKLTQIMKLRQITGGFVIDQSQETHEIPDNPKLEELDSIIETEIPEGEKFIIFAQYRYEIETLINRYKHLGVTSVYGGNASNKNLDNIDLFLKDPSIRCIILHPASAAHGITFTNSHFMIFYSIDHSAELNYQAVKRIERNGQKHPMVVWYLLCDDSIDKSIYTVIKRKLANQAACIDGDFAVESTNNEIMKEFRRTHGV